MNAGRPKLGSEAALLAGDPRIPGLDCPLDEGTGDAMADFIRKYSPIIDEHAAELVRGEGWGGKQSKASGWDEAKARRVASLVQMRDLVNAMLHAELRERL